MADALKNSVNIGKQFGTDGKPRHAGDPLAGPRARRRRNQTAAIRPWEDIRDGLKRTSSKST